MLYATIVTNIPEAVIVTTPEGEITHINRALERPMGYTSGEAIGKNIVMLVPQTPGRRVDPVKWLQRWAAVFDYIERFYNPRRRHSTLGYLSPIEFEKKMLLA